MQVTYIGHQGWQVSSGDTYLWIDPLLESGFGRSRDAKFRVFPPREIDFSAFPKIDGVLISHEHEDHFNLPTLDKLDRKTPIFLSSLASSSAFTILREMGFQVSPFSPGRKIQVGGLTIFGCFTGQLKGNWLDEFDLVSYIVFDLKEKTAFFSPVDVPISEFMKQTLWALLGANRPVLGSFDGKLQKAALQRTNGEVRIKSLEHIKALPGQTFCLERGKLLESKRLSRFIHVPPRKTWPAEPEWFGPFEKRRFPPIKKDAVFGRKQQKEVEKGLDEIAEFIFGRHPFRLMNDPLSKFCKRPTYAFFLKQGTKQKPLIYEYAPHLCRFVLSTKDHRLTDYICAIECWAGDFLGLLQGEFEPRILGAGHCRLHRQEMIGPLYFFQEILWPFFHPLRRQPQVLNRYRQQLKEMASEASSQRGS